MFSRFVKFLISGWFISLIAVLVLSGLIWFFGPLLAFAEYRPLESEFARFVTVIVLLVTWGLVNLFMVMRAKRAVLSGVSSPPGSLKHSRNTSSVAAWAVRLA